MAHNIFLQLVEAVGHCHARGVCHRDVKLENLLWDEQRGGCLKLCDFGLCTEERAPSDCVGTLCYAAPELIACADGKVRASAR